MAKLEFTITGMVVKGFPGFETCVVQAAKANDIPSDLVVRVRFPMFLRKSPNGSKFQLTTESRLAGGMIATNDLVRQWIDDVAIPDAIRLAHVESAKAGMKWPPGWPIPSYQNILEDAAAKDWRARRTPLTH